jgi:hypothetical protein
MEHQSNGLVDRALRFWRSNSPLLRFVLALWLVIALMVTAGFLVILVLLLLSLLGVIPE